MRKLNKQKVEIGFFKQQGEHEPSGLHYTELMRLHEYGTDQFRARPVFHGNWYTLSEEMQTKSFKTVLKTNVCRFINEGDNFDAHKLLDYIGQWGVRYTQTIFGDPILGVRSNPTPLLDTGELSEHVAWKVSLSGVPYTL